MEIYKLNQSFSLMENEKNYGILTTFFKDIQEWVDYFTKYNLERITEFTLIHKIPNQVYFNLSFNDNKLVI